MICKISGNESQLNNIVYTRTTVRRCWFCWIWNSSETNDEVQFFLEHHGLITIIPTEAKLLWSTSHSTFCWLPCQTRVVFGLPRLEPQLKKAICKFQSQRLISSPRGVQKIDELKKLAETDWTEFNFSDRFRCGSVLVWIFWNRNISVSVLVLDFFNPKPTEPTDIYIYIYM